MLAEERTLFLVYELKYVFKLPIITLSLGLQYRYIRKVIIRYIPRYIYLPASSSFDLALMVQFNIVATFQFRNRADKILTIEKNHNALLFTRKYIPEVWL